MRKPSEDTIIKLVYVAIAIISVAAASVLLFGDVTLHVRL